MFYIWGISGDDSGEEILLETDFNGKYILMSHRALRFQNPQISKCYAETEILGSQEQEAIKKEQNQKISWKLSTCTLLITALLWNLKEFKFLLWSSHGNSNLENAFPIQKKSFWQNLCAPAELCFWQANISWCKTVSQQILK